MGRPIEAERLQWILILWLALVCAGAVEAQVAGGRRMQVAPRSSAIDAKQLLTDIEFLSSNAMRGRAVGTPESVKAREFLVVRFRQGGLQPFGASFVQEFGFERRITKEKVSAANVIGYLKGTKHPERYIVVTAHYDHLGVQQGEIYNGADDNASGAAALAVLAEAMTKAKPRHSIVFVAFDAEEQGHQGSRYFVANLPVRKEAIVLNVNMDMLSRSDKGELYVAGLLPYPQFTNVIGKVQNSTRVKLKRGHDIPGTGRDDWTYQSDHASFHRERIPFMYFGVEDHADYHKPTDDFVSIQPEFFVRAVETILTVLIEIDREKWGSGIGVSYSN